MPRLGLVGLVAGLAALLVTVLAVGAVTHRPGADDNGVGRTPAMGWSSWSFLRHDPTEAGVEAQAKAMKDSGLAQVGYQYVNLDDFWYQCPGSQGPAVDQYGRWVVAAARFPSSGRLNGIEALARYVHALGLKFGLYVTPGISAQAVARNTAIKGTPYTADQIAEPSVTENNYNCHGMVGIDYAKPGAQQFVNSWADEFASWGVDYLKLDGVGSLDIPDIQAWSRALRQTGRRIHLELSSALDIGDAATWKQYANGWRTGGDIECYTCAAAGRSYPLTSWADVSSRFGQVAAWQPDGGPGGFNDYDSIEVGNGRDDGLTPPERQTQLSLWALAASPLILGTDLTRLDPADLALLENRDVIAVDQDAIDAARIADTATYQIFAKTEKNGDVAVGLFNTSGGREAISVSASALGLKASPEYLVRNLWSHQRTTTAGTVSAEVAAHGVALLRVVPRGSGLAWASEPGRRCHGGRMRISLGDVSLWFDVSGPSVIPQGDTTVERPVVVAVHGGPGLDHMTVKSALGPLAEDIQVVYFDLRGHGRSDRSRAEFWNMRTWADDLRRLCDALGLDKPLVLGSSFGGDVALAYAGLFPDHPGGVILTNTTGNLSDQQRTIEAFGRLGGPEAAEVARRAYADKTGEYQAEFTRVCYPLYSATPGWAEESGQFLARMIKNIDVSLHYASQRASGFDPRSVAGAVRCPVLVLTGEDDPICPLPVVEELVSRLPAQTTRLVTLPGARHTIFRDRPDLAFPAVRDFVFRVKEGQNPEVG